MPDTAPDFQDAKPRPICRSTEARETAVLTLAIRSLLVVKAEQDASWPCRVRPLNQSLNLSQVLTRTPPT